MPNAQELNAARPAAARALKELSSYLSGPHPSCPPALLRRCFRLLPYLDAGDQCLAARCRLCLLDGLRGVLSRDPSPSLLPAIEVTPPLLSIRLPRFPKDRFRSKLWLLKCPRILQVFAENLIFCGRLRSFFVKGDWAAPNESRVFAVVPRSLSEFHTVLELICNHFISALEGEGGYREFLSALSRSGNELQGAPEISFKGVLSLIRTTHSFSLPSVVRAHLLLLASRCINGPGLYSHLSEFERLIILYVGYLPTLGIFNRNGSVKTPQSPFAGKRPLTCCIREVTHHKLKNQVNGLLSFCQVHMGDNLPTSDSDIYDIADRLIEENQHMINEIFRQKAANAVRSILSNVLHCAKLHELHDSDAEVTEEIFCFAAVLRLMGSLLQYILHHFSQMGDADGEENANHAALCSNYCTFCDTICLFSHYEANELHRCDFFSTIGKPADRERASIQMLAHFASLSVFCVRRRLGFLWRICITMMIMAMNLVILEKESMDILELLIGASKESADKGNLQVTLVQTHIMIHIALLVPHTI
jgi:hypothetical protein